MSTKVAERPSAPTIDRRMRARRIEVRRREGRRRLRRLVALLGVSALVVAAWGLVRSPLLDVDEIAVVGVERTAPAEVLSVLGIDTGDALVDLDTAAAASRVAALPWIADVEVSRAWSGTIEVRVSERTPVAVVADDTGGTWWVDAGGVVLGAAPASDTEPYVQIEGADVPEVGAAVDESGTVALGLASTLPESMRPLVAAVEVDEAGEVWLRLTPRPGEVDASGAPRGDGGRVQLGDGRELDEQVRSLTAMLEQVDLTDLAVLDVRVPANPIVTRTAAGAIDTDEGADGGAPAEEDG